LGNTDSTVIETLKCPSGWEFRETGSQRRESVEWVTTPVEAHERRTRENVSVAGEEKALERKRGRTRPALPERVWRASEVRGNPMSAAGMKQGL